MGVPNFSPSKRFTGNHLRDCLVTGFSMAAEGEFAFVIAVFAVSDELIDEDLYASLILAVLVSTVIPPFALRFTIAYYNKKGEEAVARAAEMEELRDHSVVMDGNSGVDDLVDGIRNKSEVFLVIQTQSESTWGLLMNIMNVMGTYNLDVIDHRSWSPRGINTTLVNEVYAKCPIDISSYDTPEEALNVLIEKITISIKTKIDQPDSKVKVQRRFPGVVKEVVEETNEKEHKNIRGRLLKEASTRLERKQKMQIEATQGKSLLEITGEEGEGLEEEVEAKSGRDQFHRVSDYSNRKKQEDLNFSSKLSGVPAKITVKGEVFHIRISEDTVKGLESGTGGQTTDSHGVSISGIEITARDDAPVVQRLAGFVRNTNLNRIQEEDNEAPSEFSEDTNVKDV